MPFTCSVFHYWREPNSVILLSSNFVMNNSPEQTGIANWSRKNSEWSVSYIIITSHFNSCYKDLVKNTHSETKGDPTPRKELGSIQCWYLESPKTDISRLWTQSVGFITILAVVQPFRLVRSTFIWTSLVLWKRSSLAW